MMTSVRPDAVPTLNAGPFSLRPFRHDDLSLVLAAGRDPFIPQITSLPAKATAGQARDWIALQHTRVRDGVGYPFVIAKGATDEPVGSIGLWQHKIGPGRASIGYWVLDAHRRRRVASCALSAIATWGFTLPGLCDWSSTSSPGTKVPGAPPNTPVSTARGCSAVGSPSGTSAATCTCTPGSPPTPPKERELNFRSSSR